MDELLHNNKHMNELLRKNAGLSLKKTQACGKQLSQIPWEESFIRKKFSAYNMYTIMITSCCKMIEIVGFDIIMMQ